MSNESKKVELLFNSLAEEVFSMPDEEFQQELKDIDKTTAKTEADKLKNIFKNSLSEFQLKNREKAKPQQKKILNSEIAKLLSKTLDEKIEYIKNLIEDCKIYGLPQPTLQFRNLEQMTDEDADLILKKLSENGLIDSIKKAKDE